jgi:hypothetical protein
MKTVLADFLRTYWLPAVLVLALLAVLAVTLSGAHTDHAATKAAAQARAAAHRRAAIYTERARAAYDQSRPDSTAAAGYDTTATRWASQAATLHHHTHPRHAASPSPAAADSAVQAARRFLTSY